MSARGQVLHQVFNTHQLHLILVPIEQMEKMGAEGSRN